MKLFNSLILASFINAAAVSEGDDEDKTKVDFMDIELLDSIVMEPFEGSSDETVPVPEKDDDSHDGGSKPGDDEDHDHHENDDDHHQEGENDHHHEHDHEDESDGNNGDDKPDKGDNGPYVYIEFGSGDASTVAISCTLLALTMHL